MDFEFEHYREPLNPGEGGDNNILQSIGTFLKHNIEDIFDDLAQPQEPTDRPRSTSCPRGQRAPSHQDSQHRTAAQRHVESQWRWDSPPRSRPGDRSNSSVSLTTSPDSKGLLDVVVSGFSNLGHQATAFLNTLDANFEQIFKPEDDSPDERPPQPVSAPTARPDGAGARPLPSSKSSKPRGKLGANRLITAASAAPAPSSAAASVSASSLQPPSGVAPSTTPASRAVSLPTGGVNTGNARVQGVSPHKPNRAAAAAAAPACRNKNSKAGPGVMTCSDVDTLPQLPKRGGNQGSRESSRASAASAPEQTVLAANQIRAAARAPETVAATATVVAGPADSLVLPPSPPEADAHSRPGSVEGASADNTGAASSTAAPAAGAAAAAPRVLGAVDKRRCIKVLFQEVAGLREERSALQSQLRDMAGKQAALELQLQQLSQHNAELAAENESLRAPAMAHDPMADRAVLRQMQLLLNDKSRLAEENSRLASENHSLHLLLALATEHSTLLGTESGSEWPSPSPAATPASARPAEQSYADGQVGPSPLEGGECGGAGAGQVPRCDIAAAVRSLDYSQEVAEVSEIRRYYAELLGTPNAYEQGPPVFFAGADDQCGKDSGPCGGNAVGRDLEADRDSEPGRGSDADGGSRPLCDTRPHACTQLDMGEQPDRQDKQPERVSFECEALVKLHGVVQAQASAKAEPHAASPAPRIQS